MIDFPNAKINLGLNITGKRPDGYHDIESVFYPVNWRDTLEINPRKDNEINFQVKGMDERPYFDTKDLVTEKEVLWSRELNDESPVLNLCETAYAIMQKHYDIPGANISLQKYIPTGAGLGGGSADAAFTLKMVNNLYGLKLSEERLEQHAASLGSDCPFFIRNEPVYVSGRGEKLNPIDIKLKGFYIVVMYPGFHVSTKWAYGKIEPQKPQTDLLTIIQQDFSQWRKFLKNDFQAVVDRERSQISANIEKFYDHGAVYSSMSGSGSSVYGIFENYPENIPFHPDDIHITTPL